MKNMVNDKELFIQSIESYVLNTVSSLFGFESLATQTFLRYGVRVMADKYGFLLDLFADKSGNLNIPLLIDAAKSEIKARGGVKVWNIKFTEKDIEEIYDIYLKLSENNHEC